MNAADIIRQVIISAPPVLIAITFHEVAHGYAAYRMGDPTAKALGRLTLNPIAHIDPVGTILLPAMLLIFSGGQFVFGYAKPVPINPYNFRNPRKGMALTAAAGPGINFALALASLFLLKFLLLPLKGILPPEAMEPLFLMLQSSLYLNIVLAAFNLLPVPPLDGGRILAGLVPPRMAQTLDRVEPYGMFIVIILLVTDLYKVIVHPIRLLLIWLLELFV